MHDAEHDAGEAAGHVHTEPDANSEAAEEHDDGVATEMAAALDTGMKALSQCWSKALSSTYLSLSIPSLSLSKA